jgi:hypothetical protein
MYREALHGKPPNLVCGHAPLICLECRKQADNASRMSTHLARLVGELLLHRVEGFGGIGRLLIGTRAR